MLSPRMKPGFHFLIQSSIVCEQDSQTDKLLCLRQRLISNSIGAFHLLLVDCKLPLWSLKVMAWRSQQKRKHIISKKQKWDLEVPDILLSWTALCKRVRMKRSSVYTRMISTLCRYWGHSSCFVLFPQSNTKNESSFVHFVSAKY